MKKKDYSVFAVLVNVAGALLVAGAVIFTLLVIFRPDLLR